MDVDHDMPSIFTSLVGSLVVAYTISLLLHWRHTCTSLRFDWVYNQLFRLSRLGRAKRETVYISDPRALQEILVKEHGTVFMHVPGHLEVNNLIFGPGLLGTSGDTHKLQRKALNPVFTTLHTKSKTSKMASVAQELSDTIASTMNGAGTKEINILEWCQTATLETIGQAGFGYTFGAIRDSDSPYIAAMRNLIPSVIPLYRFRRHIFWISRLTPRGPGVRLVKWAVYRYIQCFKKTADTQTKYSKHILGSRKVVVSDNTGGEFNDILSTLLRFNARANEDEKLSDDQLRGQINTFVFAGFETTSASLARTLHLLAEHPHIQTRLRTELLNASPDLEDLDKLPYLNAVVRETLRLYPPVPTIERYATKDWVVPLRYPTKDNKQEMHIKKGSRRDIADIRTRETWGEDAEEFRPERWLAALPQSVAEAKIQGVYPSLMTFSAGPRSCIGYKFAVLELKIILSRLVKTFRFDPGQQSIEWSGHGCISPHVVKTLEDGTTVSDKAPTLPLMVSTV
ncbi:unnamed protein product [Rhizoctonia solani]|uniref:Cytochrome P450 family protein n=1 Tax=Rhizoctonia solani TaxID=456999 RepID=A0A8H3ADW9_9AGAM|nr:unnamed protein product [Rhizoctonia solani]